MLNKNQGFSLVQLLVASLVLALGVMGLVSVQLNNQKQMFTGFEQTQLGFYAQDMQAILSANICYINTNDFNAKNASDIKKLFSNITLKPDTITFEVENINNNQTEVENRGYWEFEFEISSSKTSATSWQKFIVEYKEDGC